MALVSITADLSRVQELFTFAWEHTVYRANLVALRNELGLGDKIHLPVDEEIARLEESLGISHVAD